MSKIATIPLLIFLIALGVTKQSEAANETVGSRKVCLDRASQLDKCLIKLTFYGDRNFDPPRSDRELDEHCLMLDDNLKCVSSYSRECLPPFARNIYSVVTRRLKGLFNKRCKNKDGRKEFLDMMACAEPRHMESHHKCMDAFIAHLERLGSGAQNRQIELTCCAFQIFEDCIFAATQRVKCPHRIVSSEKSINYVKTIINSMGGDVMDFMCGKYETISACQAGYPKEMSRFRNITHRIFNGTMRPQATSPIKPMLQLFASDQDN